MSVCKCIQYLKYCIYELKNKFLNEFVVRKITTEPQNQNLVWGSVNEFNKLIYI